MSSDQHSGDIKFTVIIPVYNGATTISRAVDSVLAQSYAAHEIIVIDDASTDGTNTLLTDNYAGRVTLIRKIQNCGSSVARNTGMAAATGNYIAFLDADDIWHPDKLLLISTILSANPAISFFYHPFTLEDICKKRLPEDITIYKLPFIKLLPGNLIATSCAVIRNNPSFRFEPTMRYTEDYDLWLRIGYHHKIHFINIPLTRIFRGFTTTGGISANRWAMRRGEMRAYRRIVRLNPVFLLILPMLLLSSLGKHFIKNIGK